MSERAGRADGIRKDQRGGDDVFRFTQLPFQLRYVYILELVSQIEKTLRTLVYIDTEAYLWLAAELFENHERFATAFPIWRERPAPEGGSLFDPAGSVYAITGTMATHRSTGGPIIAWHAFRTLVPTELDFDQKINTGEVPETFFLPQRLEH